MPVWRLTPVNLTDPDWSGSSWKAPVIVRAPSEKDARRMAKRRFLTSPRKLNGRHPAANPWKQPVLVLAEQIHNPRWPVEGPAGVLVPADGGSTPDRRDRQQHQ